MGSDNSAKGYLNENLEEIIQTGKYSRIIIEPSGLGGIDMDTNWKRLEITELYTNWLYFFETCKFCVQNEIIIITDRTESDFISVFDVEIESTILES